MEFAVRHFMAGRLRLFVPALRRRRSLAEAALGWLRGQPGIKRARINYECASLVVEFDPAHEPLLRALLGRLALISIDDLRAMVQPMGAHAQRTPSESQSSVRSQPLARALAAPPIRLFEPSICR
jgi:Heavy metal associated domain 2